MVNDKRNVDSDDTLTRANAIRRPQTQFDYVNSVQPRDVRGA